LISSKIKTKKIDDENYHYLVVKVHNLTIRQDCFNL